MTGDAQGTRSTRRTIDARIALCVGASLGLGDVVVASTRASGDADVFARAAIFGALLLGAEAVVVTTALRALLGRLGVEVGPAGLVRSGRVVFARTGALFATAVVLVIACAFCFIGFPVQPPFGLHRLVAGGLVLAIGAVLLVALRLVSARNAQAERVAWVALFGLALFIETGPFYEFSRLWPSYTPSLESNAIMSSMHSVGLLLVLVVGVVALRCAAPALARGLGEPGGREGRVLALGALAFVLVARSALTRAPHEDRILLHERGRIVYRGLELSPRAPVEMPALREVPHEPPSRPARRRVRGVVVLLADALRADMLTRRLDGEPVTPELAELGARSSRFARAYATVPATHESVAAMLTGRRDAFEDEDAFARESLGARLRPAGVRTFGIYGHEALAEAIAPMDVRVPYGTGPTNKGKLTSQIALAHVEEALDDVGASPFFLFAHFYDAHAHYVSNPRFDFGDTLLERYAAEAAYVDAHLGLVVDALVRRGLDDEVAVVVVSDHGEELWDHGYRWHRKRVYDESAHVVFEVHAPFAAPRTIATPVSLVDLAPTVLELLGVAVPRGLDGRSRVPELEGHPPAAQEIVVAQAGDGSAFAVIDGRHKAVYYPFTGAIELFDLTRDPRERHNLADARLGEATRLLDRGLSGWR